MWNWDIWIAFGIAVFTFAMAYMGVHVTLHPPVTNSEKWFWKIGFGLCAALCVSLVIWQTVRNQASQKELTAQLSSIKVQQASTEGELAGIKDIMGDAVKTGIPGLQAFAQSILTAIQSNHAQVVNNAQGLSDKELCSRTANLASSMRKFEEDFSKKEMDHLEITRSQASSTMTHDEILNAFREEAQARRQREDEHDAHLKNDFFPDAKYYHDLIMQRLSAKQRDALVSANGESEVMLVLMQRAGAGDGMMLAGYLDEMRNTLCGAK